MSTVYTTYHTPTLHTAQQQLQQRMDDEARRLVDTLFALKQAKGTAYDQLRTFAERMPFGDASWGTLMFIKADRVCSLINGGNQDDNDIEEVVKDLVVYAMYYLAWRAIVSEEVNTNL